MDWKSRSGNCCCCFNIKTGTLIILCLDILYLLISVTALFYLLYADVSKTEVSYNPSKIEGFSVYAGVKYPPKLVENLKKLFIVLIICSAIRFLIILGALFSIKKKKPCLLFPYFIYRCFAVVAAILATLFTVLLKIKGPEWLSEIERDDDFHKILRSMIQDFMAISLKEEFVVAAVKWAQKSVYFIIFVQILIIFVQIHFARVVYTYYKEMRKDTRRGSGTIYELQKYKQRIDLIRMNPNP